MEKIYAPAEVLTLIIQRNAASFNQILEHKYSGTQKNIPYLDVLQDGPEKVVDALIAQFHGRYGEIDFDLPEFVAGWARQFQKSWYVALERLCESMRASKPAPLDLENASLDDVLRHCIFSLISLQNLLQRFLEGDEKRYLFETLGITSDISDRWTIFTTLQTYLRSHPSEHDKEVLWIAIRSLRNGDTLGSDDNPIFVDFIDSVCDQDFSGAFDIIASSTLHEVLAREHTLINDSCFHELYRTEKRGLHHEKLIQMKNPLIDERIRAIMGCLETAEDPLVYLEWLSITEQEVVFLSLRDIWRKPGQKRDILDTIAVSMFTTAVGAMHPLGPNTIGYLFRMPGYRQQVIEYCLSLFEIVPQERYVKILLQEARSESAKKNIVHTILLPLFRKKNTLPLQQLSYIWNYSDGGDIETSVVKLDVASFVEFYWYIESTPRKEALMRLCKSQIKQIFYEVQNWNFAPYALFLRNITLWEELQPFVALFGFSNLFLKQSKQLPLLPTARPPTIIERTKSHIVQIFYKGTKQYEKIVQQLLDDAGMLRESLLSCFADGYFPIGWKIHFSSSLSQEKVTLLHQIVGFGNTSFRLLHSDTSLNLPPCQSPLELIAILHRLCELGIVVDNDLQLQLSVAGRVPNMLAGVLGSICLFAKPHKKEYKPEAFISSQNDKTASCICCYDDGVLDREWFPTIPPHVQGRIDTLWFSSIIEVVTYYVVANLVSQSYFGGRFEKIGKKCIEEYLPILRKNNLIDILEKKWVHTPGMKSSPEQEEEHHRTVKRCTDILWTDIDAYTEWRDASGLSFEIKQLIYDYIVRYNLLPVQEGWVQNYFRYLNYQRVTLSHAVIPVLEIQ